MTRMDGESPLYNEGLYENIQVMALDDQRTLPMADSCTKEVTGRSPGGLTPYDYIISQIKKI